MGKENKFPEIIYLVDVDGDGIIKNHVWSDDPGPAPGIDKKGSVAYRRIDDDTMKPIKQDVPADGSPEQERIKAALEAKRLMEARVSMERSKKEDADHQLRLFKEE